MMAGRKGVVEAIEPFGRQTRVHVEEEVVNVLHGKAKVFEPEFVGQLDVAVELCRVEGVAPGGHDGSCPIPFGLAACALSRSASSAGCEGSRTS
jgi:hypothetical protein